jgi:hypothetical protein
MSQSKKNKKSLFKHIRFRRSKSLVKGLSDFKRSTVNDITHIMDKTALQQASRFMLDRDHLESPKRLW